jgi:hypothetical protein
VATIVTAALQRHYSQTELTFWITLVYKNAHLLVDYYKLCSLVYSQTCSPVTYVTAEDGIYALKHAVTYEVEIICAPAMLRIGFELYVMVLLHIGPV